jgi:phage terminase small subunit
MALNNKQAAFVREYAIDHNATQAALRAGYSERTAEQIGYQLLQKTSVKEAVEAQTKEHAERCAVTVDSLSGELSADRELARHLEMPTAAISATMGQAKLHGLLTDKADVNIRGGLSVNIELNAVRPEPS